MWKFSFALPFVEETLLSLGNNFSLFVNDQLFVDVCISFYSFYSVNKNNLLYRKYKNTEKQFEVLGAVSFFS